MRKVLLRFLPAVSAACALALSGCMGYSLTPEKPASMPRSEAAPLPLTAGFVPGPDRGFSEKLSEALVDARVFKEVRRGATAGVDVVLRPRFKSEFIQDPLQAPKILLCVFTGFVTGALMSETSHHLAEGAVELAYPEGGTLKSYDERVDVVAKSMVSMFAEQKTMKLGPPAAMENLVARLVKRLIDDREFLSALESGRTAPFPARPEPVAAAEPARAEPAAAPAPEASEEPAAVPEPVASAEPEPAPRRPLTPAEELEIDAQIMP